MEGVTTMAKTYTEKLPALEDIERLVQLPPNADECAALCDELNMLWDERQTDPDLKDRVRIDATIRVVARHMAALGCRKCLPQ
jgi:hypothetical protein